VTDPTGRLGLHSEDVGKETKEEATPMNVAVVEATPMKVIAPVENYFVRVRVRVRVR